MTDINFFKIEPNFEPGFWDFLSPKNWGRKKYSKETVNILFIDDLDMPVVENLKRAGYRVRKVRDVKDTDDAEVKDAQIIFSDFDGVGRSISAHHQGAGIVKEIKARYGSSKYVVLYTAQPTLPSDTIMRSLFDAADARLRKDADTTDFTEQIRIALKQLR